MNFRPPAPLLSISVRYEAFRLLLFLAIDGSNVRTICRVFYIASEEFVNLLHRSRYPAEKPENLPVDANMDVGAASIVRNP